MGCCFKEEMCWSPKYKRQLRKDKSIEEGRVIFAWAFTSEETGGIPTWKPFLVGEEKRGSDVHRETV